MEFGNGAMFEVVLCSAGHVPSQHGPARSRSSLDRLGSVDSYSIPIVPRCLLHTENFSDPSNSLQAVLRQML